MFLGLRLATSDQLCHFQQRVELWGVVSAMMAEFPSEPSVDPGSNLGIFFEGVDESTWQSQRLDCFDVFVEMELGLGKYARSGTRRARLLVFDVQLTIVAANTKPLD
jgi:hypothetical protein